MNTYVLDTSVSVAWYVDETFSPSAREWQDRFLTGKVRLVVPSLHYLEFANVLRTLVLRGELKEDLAFDIHSLHLDAPIEVLEPDRNSVLKTALAYGSTVYDAAFIELAVAHDAKLLTAERTTTVWVKKLGKRAEIVR